MCRSLKSSWTVINIALKLWVGIIYICPLIFLSNKHQFIIGDNDYQQLKSTKRHLFIKALLISLSLLLFTVTYYLSFYLPIYDLCFLFPFIMFNQLYLAIVHLFITCYPRMLRLISITVILNISLFSFYLPFFSLSYYSLGTYIHTYYPLPKEPAKLNKWQKYA